MKEASKNPILMAMEFYIIKIKLWCILEIGLTVSLMEKVKKYMKMEQLIEETFSMENGMAMASINGKMVVFIRDNFTRELCMGMVISLT